MTIGQIILFSVVFCIVKLVVDEIFYSAQARWYRRYAIPNPKPKTKKHKKVKHKRGKA